MALPVFFNENHNGSLNALTLAWPASHQAGDIAILLVETANQAATLSTPAGFVEIPDSPQGGGTAASTTATRVTAFWCRATSGAMASPTIADSGDHQFALMLVFRGCIATGDPWDVTAGDAATTDTAVSIPGDTTTVADCLIVAICSRAQDDAGAVFSAWANSDLANVAELFDAGATAGNGGGFGVATGEKAVAGAFGATTATLGSTSIQGRIAIALKPPVAGAALEGTATVAVSGAAALSTGIPLAGAGTVAISGAAALTTGIQLAGAATVSVSGSGDLTSGAGAVLEGAATVAVSGAAELTTGIPLSGTATVAVSAAAVLTTGIRLLGAAQVAFSGAAALTTGIQLVGAATITVAGAAQLTTQIQLAGAATVAITATADLTGGATPVIYEYIAISTGRSQYQATPRGQSQYAAEPFGRSLYMAVPHD